MKRINSSYKLIEFLSGRRSCADTVVNVATIEFRFRAIVLIEIFVLDVAYEKIGVAGSHFCAHDKEDDSNTSDKDIFETLQTGNSKWTPPEGQFASLDFFIKKCRHDINKLNFNRNTKFSNLS